MKQVEISGISKGK